jgi:hypothetical protein
LIEVLESTRPPLIIHTLAANRLKMYDHAVHYLLAKHCKFNPMTVPGGMFHCPQCGEMQLGGYPHIADEEAGEALLNVLLGEATVAL